MDSWTLCTSHVLQHINVPPNVAYKLLNFICSYISIWRMLNKSGLRRSLELMRKENIPCIDNRNMLGYLTLTDLIDYIICRIFIKFSIIVNINARIRQLIYTNQQQEKCMWFVLSSMCMGVKAYFLLGYIIILALAVLALNINT